MGITRALRMFVKATSLPPSKTPSIILTTWQNLWVSNTSAWAAIPICKGYDRMPPKENENCAPAIRAVCVPRKN